MAFAIDSPHSLTKMSYFNITGLWLCRLTDNTWAKPPH